MTGDEINSIRIWGAWMWWPSKAYLSRLLVACLVSGCAGGALTFLGAALILRTAPTVCFVLGAALAFVTRPHVVAFYNAAPWRWLFQRHTA